ncbi:TonB-dependent receptor [Flavicella marina]|uniref:TonB-dependent receptor n=1 Tax=Flavicella marina TaxID=1475951 RepID=UPI0012656CA3|nr:TonB-dependent receptor [Flavicella marina]
MRKYLSLLVCLMGVFFLKAQKLSGVVLNTSKTKIHSVSILNISSGKHTHTDEKGKFSLETKKGDTLQFSHLSYKSKDIIISDTNSSIQIVLTKNSFNLDEVIIGSRVNALSVISDIDIETNPVNSSQELLRKVPGLFIGQHAGGGKAEQIFLRGFDVDHGTDINISVDGLPVNMVSHAHGQGYADLHFVIPETLQNIDFGKGPYYQNKGNFNTAGYVNFTTKNQIDRNSIKMEFGQFDTFRLCGMFNILQTATQNAYLATEYISTDGPFESPQNFNRINLFGKYRGSVSATDILGITLSHFTSKWDASGQIPQRAVDSGLITRWGAIDDTEGGITSRSNLVIDFDKNLDANTTIKNKIFYSTYGFELFSNFTFFLDDPINGDQIKQKEKRNIYGFRSDFNKDFDLNKLYGSWQAGISIRHDQSKNNELSHTANRKETLENIKLGDIQESNLSGYLGVKLEFDRWIINPALRIDHFNFQYNDALQTTYETQNKQDLIVSPKLNILFNPTNDLQLYTKFGKGFHSNDTRVVIEENGKQTLPGAYGFDAGFIWKPTTSMLLNIAYWYLYLEQEFVYVGDAGIVEPSEKTKRQGIELSYRYQPLPWLYWNIDVNYTHARAIEENKGEDYIPLAPDFTLVSGLNILHKSGFFGGLNLRHIKDRPANEDNSINAIGYTVTDLNAGYNWDNFSLSIQIENLFNTNWNETQFATLSRLRGEVTPVEEIHFTPGTPLFLKTILTYRF